jgi:AAA+ ATPase superfamily predicted ATPase
MVKKAEPANPFLLSGYHSREYFCDREKETRQLISNAENGVNTTLLSLRRMGKTGLLQHVLSQLPKKRITGIYLDIFDTSDFAGFTNKLATAVYRSIPEKTPLWKKMTEFIRQLRPVISYDDITGQPEVALEYRKVSQFQQSMSSIFSFLEKQDHPLLVAIDEFQQITRYPEKNTEAVLRTQIQQLKNVRFIFSGSSPHLLSEMFNSVKRPFFASTQTMELTEISADNYGKFINRQFELNRRKIDGEALAFVLSFTRRHTFYTQALCNRIYAGGQKHITLEGARLAARGLLQENEAVYYQYRTMLTANQWRMLTAIAHEEKLKRPTARAIASTYDLGGTSVIQRSIEALLSKEMIYLGNTDKEKFYAVYDVFLQRWLQQL